MPKRFCQSTEELEEFSKIHVMGANYDNVDGSQIYALVSIVGPDVPQCPLNANNRPIDFHGLVVWACVTQDSGPEFERLKARASKASGGQLDVYVLKTCAMAPLKFKQDDFKVQNTSWADERVHELMQGVRRGNENAAQLFEERKQQLQAGNTTSAMVKEELDRLERDLEKMDADREMTRQNIAMYQDKYARLTQSGV